NAEMRFNKALQACLCGSIIARNENAVELAKKSKREAIWVRFPSGKPNALFKLSANVSPSTIHYSFSSL
ncbi:MAG: hypothetical protein IJJ41_09340, partial [Clostridia bacterium]|nr:hypothetical protein [Clostridia bacterium]